MIAILTADGCLLRGGSLVGSGGLTAYNMPDQNRQRPVYILEIVIIRVRHIGLTQHCSFGPLSNTQCHGIVVIVKGIKYMTQAAVRRKTNCKWSRPLPRFHP